jgi:hypothetical protein
LPACTFNLASSTNFMKWTDPRRNERAQPGAQSTSGTHN